MANKTVRLTILVDPATAASIKREAKKAGVSVAEYIRRLMSK